MLYMHGLVSRRELGGKRLADRLRREGRRVLTRMRRHGTRPLAFPSLISNYIRQEVIKRYGNFQAGSRAAETSEGSVARVLEKRFQERRRSL